ncbi:hypothetical protein HZF24_07880 [Sedimentibacter hydroxybenzoicus DSM 7310]|uniref:Uncharacterized protein n=1 Tax=Sedimentibacter hydroxybenzoicus DSM 7310 TaxID=1123245 RepID=A0A974BJZ9_SEDHY|nr:hypothetical protein [Sedimentibacter hydroxybenzoicus]NYB74060.1 hypothetical protein [Sedimentibacter hydroxybenzoicus DSM 7310]
MYKNTKWTKEIIALQEDDGKWGCFHSLSQSYQSSITTEQALRRLLYLGYTIEDECIKKAVAYMNDCLIGKKEIPDRREKLHNWDIFTELILAAWIRIFRNDNVNANSVAEKWSNIISSAFSSGEYDHEEYISTYHKILGIKPKGGRFIDFVNFYPLSLLAGCLDEETESAFIEYVLNKDTGIYYIYDHKIYTLPNAFKSRDASRFLGAIELLSKYKASKAKLRFVVNWLESNKNQDGKWDMGSVTNDKIYFPLSDNWRKKETRESDCTERITKIILSLSQ